VSILADARTGSVLHPFGVTTTALDLDGLLERIHADLHPRQREFIDDTHHKIIGVSAGYGAGKTRALCAKAVTLASMNQGFIGCVMEPTGPLIRDIWQNDFDDFLYHYEIPHTFRASPLPEYTLHLPGGDTKILCRSFENWTRIIGLNLAWCLADEIDTVNRGIAEKAFSKILGRLRSGIVRQFGAVSTPEGFTWMWNTFGSEEAQLREDRHLIRMRTQDNPHLPDDFITTLQANYDPALLQAYLEGQFVNLTTGQVYSRFSRDKHVKPVQRDDEEPILIGIDFNVGNTNGILSVRRGRELHVFDEIRAHDTDALGAEVRRRYPDARVLGYPDASGASRSTNSSRSDVAILQEYDISNMSPKANPPVRDRVNAVQAMLENGKGEVRLFIDPRCKGLIEDLELQSYDEKGEPDKTNGYDHRCDAVGYTVHRCFEVGRATSGKAVRGIRLY
jgi:hypothetical protein